MKIVLTLTALEGSPSFGLEIPDEEEIIKKCKEKMAKDDFITEPKWRLHLFEHFLEDAFCDGLMINVAELPKGYTP